MSSCGTKQQTDSESEKEIATIENTTSQDQSKDQGFAKQDRLEAVQNNKETKNVEPANKRAL